MRVIHYQNNQLVMIELTIFGGIVAIAFVVGWIAGQYVDYRGERSMIAEENDFFRWNVSSDDVEPIDDVAQLAPEMIEELIEKAKVAEETTSCYRDHGHIRGSDNQLYSWFVKNRQKLILVRK